jgi:hypothetical protein
VWKKDGLNEKMKKGEKKEIIMIKKLSRFSDILHPQAPSFYTC